MRPHKRFGAFKVMIGLLLIAGCASETAKPPAPRTSANPPEMAGRSPSEKFPPSSQKEKSSLDAHREGSALSSGPMKEAFFEFDSYNLTAEARKTLQANAAWLKTNPAASVEIEGHCDERGTTEYNLALGAKRARAAMDYLVSLGVSPSRIKTTSYGEELPACKEATESCYQKNRRERLVEVRAKPAS
jgi:peptidoglycan-associated lipoprotein